MDIKMMEMDLKDLIHCINSIDDEETLNTIKQFCNTKIDIKKQDAQSISYNDLCALLLSLCIDIVPAEQGKFLRIESTGINQYTSRDVCGISGIFEYDDFGKVSETCGAHMSIGDNDCGLKLLQRDEMKIAEWVLLLKKPVIKHKTKIDRYDIFLYGNVIVARHIQECERVTYIITTKDHLTITGFTNLCLSYPCQGDDIIYISLPLDVLKDSTWSSLKYQSLITWKNSV